ncbi:hypothetical protein [Brevundimonas fluminis]|uniref:hypothetical protein n=1 Tax=Brevundimonas fluminis TaxID=2487274 RepID=UPI000F656B3D|nr:hypothetical protein [Brevundimonas fluminis]
MVAKVPKQSDSYADVNQRYAGYVDVKCSLDSLLWQNHAALVAITALGAGALGAVLETELRLGSVSHQRTVAAVFFLLSLLYFLTAHSSSRLKHWHSVAEEELQKLEPDGYFHRRAPRTAHLKSASSWLIYIYFGLSAACLFAAVDFTW